MFHAVSLFFFLWQTALPIVGDMGALLKVFLPRGLTIITTRWKEYPDLVVENDSYLLISKSSILSMHGCFQFSEILQRELFRRMKCCQYLYYVLSAWGCCMPDMHNLGYDFTAWWPSVRWGKLGVVLLFFLLINKICIIQMSDTKTLFHVIPQNPKYAPWE